MPKENPKPRSSRFTLAPLYLAAGLAVGYLLVTRFIPKLEEVVGEPNKQPTQDAAPTPFALQVSNWAQQHPSTCLTALVTVAIAGFVLAIFVKPARFLVWLLALTVFLGDVALVATAYGRMISTLLQEAMGLDR